MFVQCPNLHVTLVIDHMLLLHPHPNSIVLSGFPNNFMGGERYCEI